jgi:thioredoxin 1
MWYKVGTDLFLLTTPLAAFRSRGESSFGDDMVNIPEINDENFDAMVMESDRPVLVDFGAEWCHPCNQLDPIVEELASEWDGKVSIFKLDIDVNINSAMRFGVMGVPTLLLFVAGEPVERLTGYVPKKRIIAKLKPHLGM